MRVLLLYHTDSYDFEVLPVYQKKYLDPPKGQESCQMAADMREILDYPGKVTLEIGKAFVESDFEKYRIVQDRLFESDFNRHLERLAES